MWGQERRVPNADEEPPGARNGRRLDAAEEVAGNVVGEVLARAGQTLYSNHIQRRKFPFAREIAEQAMLSQLDMCFVPHEEEESLDDWDLEGEVFPAGMDSISRHCIPIRSRVKDEDHEIEQWTRTTRSKLRRTKQSRLLGSEDVESSSCSAMTSSSDRLAAQPVRTRADTAGILTEFKRDEESEGKMSISPTKADANAWRTMPLEEEEQDHEADAERKEEDLLRLRKTVRDTMRRKREAEEKARLAAEAAKERIIAKHVARNKSKGPCTYDSNGRIIWIRPLQVELLPDTMENFLYDITGQDEDVQLTVSETLGSLQESSCMVRSSIDMLELPESAQKQTRSRTYRQSHAQRPSNRNSSFTDGFKPLESRQPSPLDTMELVPGVVLECLEKTKSGGELQTTGNRMTRNEYIQLTLQDAAGKVRPHTGSGQRDRSFAKTPSTPTLRPSSAPLGGSSSAPLGGSASVPGLTVEVSDEGKIQKAPPAPPWSLRAAKKAEAQPHHLTRQPRYHAATLGGTSPKGPLPPPLGATMGHGWMMNSSQRDAFYFPSASRTHRTIRASSAGTTRSSSAKPRKR